MNDSSKEEEIEDFIKYLKTRGAKTGHTLLAALMIWLFGVLVFIPLARSINQQTEAACTLILFLAFSVPIFKSLPALKQLIDTFSVLPARKIGLRKGWNLKSSILLFRYVLYITSGLILYLLYLPFLATFHPALSGIALIPILIWIFFLAFRILSVLSQKMVEWLLD